eukprot:7194909-Prymnesium_polylepis.1
MAEDHRSSPNQRRPLGLWIELEAHTYTHFHVTKYTARAHPRNVPVLQAVFSNPKVRTHASLAQFPHQRECVID